MDKFPKKYNPKKTIKEENTNNTWIELLSDNIPLDQNINPGSIFSLYFRDMYCKYHNICNQKNQEQFRNNIWFTTSSLYYSSLETENPKRIKLQTEKKVKKNITFLKNLWLNIDDSAKNFAMTERFSRYVRTVFASLYNNKKLINEQNLIYRSKKYQTNISDANIEIKEVEEPYYSIKYFIEAKWQTINVRTTRLETIFSDVAIAVNPLDKRYKKLIWQNVIIPIINKIIPIIWDESVDIFNGEWAIRVTPWHELFGLEVAKKHNLPTDVFAIDTNWKFTENAWEFAWKDVSEFYDNIVKYIDDIWNLNWQWTIKENRFFDKNTWEELFPITVHQRNMNYWYSKDFLFDFIKNSENFNDIYWKNEYLTSLLENKKWYVISKKSNKGNLLPLVWNQEKDLLFCIDDESILDIYRQKKSKKDIVMTLVILNLILDNDLSTTFSLENLVEVLFSRNFMGNNTKIWEYIDIYTSLSQENSAYKDGLKSLKRLVETLDRDAEKIELLLDVLKDSFGIQIDNENISVNFHDFFWEAWLDFITNDSFNKSFIDSCSFLYRLGCKYEEKPYSEIQAENSTFMVSKDNCNDFLDLCLLALEYSKRLLFSDLVYHPMLVDEKWQKINNYNSKFYSKDFYENLNLYWANIIRSTILLWENYDENKDLFIFNTYRINEYKILIDKIWNANRYIFSKFREKYAHKKVNIAEILEWIDLENISDYDTWILQDLKMMLDEFCYENAEEKIILLWKKILKNYSSFFCDKYINITKILKKECTISVLIFVNFVFLKLLYPYIPNFISEILDIFDIDWQWVDIFNLNIFDTKEKNYKINIFLDLIDKIVYLKWKLWIKKHEFVDIFVQANPDFLQFLQINESVFRLLTNIQDINLVKLYDKIPDWYETDNVINISLWIKRPDTVKVEIRKDVLADLENEFKNKQEHLQHLKSLLTSVYLDADPDLITKKREEIAKLQEEIEEIEFRIGKLKVKNE